MTWNVTIEPDSSRRPRDPRHRARPDGRARGRASDRAPPQGDHAHGRNSGALAEVDPPPMYAARADPSVQPATAIDRSERRRAAARRRDRRRDRGRRDGDSLGRPPACRAGAHAGPDRGRIERAGHACPAGADPIVDVAKEMLPSVVTVVNSPRVGAAAVERLRLRHRRARLRRDEQPRRREHPRRRARAPRST